VAGDLITAGLGLSTLPAVGSVALVPGPAPLP